MSDASKRQVWERKKPENAWKQVDRPQQQVWMPTRAYAIENIPMTRTLVTDAITVRIIGSHLTSTLVQVAGCTLSWYRKKTLEFSPKVWSFVCTHLACGERGCRLFVLFFLFVLIIFHCTHRLYSRGWQWERAQIGQGQNSSFSPSWFAQLNLGGERLSKGQWLMGDV